MSGLSRTLDMTDNDRQWDMLDDRVEEDFRASQLRLGQLCLCDVVDDGQTRIAPVIGEGARVDRDLDHRAVALDMLAYILNELIVGQSMDKSLEPRAVFGGPQVSYAHRHELFTGVAVMDHGSLVDGEEAQCLAVDHPHRDGVAFEQQAEGFLAMFGLCDVLVRWHPAVIGHRLMDDGDIAAISQLIGCLVGHASCDVVETGL